MTERDNASVRPETPRPARRSLRRPAARLGFAVALTAPVLGAGVAATSVEDSAERELASATTAVGVGEVIDLRELAARTDRASRSQARPARQVTLTPRAVDHLWATAPLNLWAGPGEDTRRVGLIEEGTKIAVTGQRDGRWAEVLVKGQDRWVNATYLAQSKPKPEPRPSRSSGATGSTGSSGASSAPGLSFAPCADGSSIESGTTPNADMVYRAVCNAFPELTSYGGYDPHGEHADGRAYDFMVSSSSLGNAIAEFVRANASQLNVRTIIWAQRIWTPERAGEGWRSMSDRGSATANHYTHVHVSVY
jgi:hypothetical protein